MEDNVPGYYRGAGWYKKTLRALASWKGKQVYLCFNGAKKTVAIVRNDQGIRLE